MALSRRKDGTYLHEILLFIERDDPGFIVSETVSETQGRHANIQNDSELQDFLANCRFFDGSTKDLLAGWTCKVACYDELWSCMLGEDY